MINKSQLWPERVLKPVESFFVQKETYSIYPPTGSSTIIFTEGRKRKYKIQYNVLFKGYIYVSSDTAK